MPSPDGDRGTAPSTDATPTRWPTYPTSAPPSTTLRYTLVQGSTTGEAELAWLIDPAQGTYTLHVTQRPADHPVREWQSSGTFDTGGIAPERLVEREKGRDKRATNFDRANQHVRFSGSTQALPMAPGAQDRWSWVVQLAAIAQAAQAAQAAQTAQAAQPTHAIPPGTTWDIQVAGLRGELDRWRFRVLADVSSGNDALTPAFRAPALLHVLREPERPFDLRIEAWLSPALHYLPIGLRMSNPPGAWSIALFPPEGGS
jgi:hypothetical protein